MHHPTARIAHTTAFVTPVVEHWLEREIAQWVHPMKGRSDDPSHHERTLLPRSYISLLVNLRTNQMYIYNVSSNNRFWPINRSQLCDSMFLMSCDMRLIRIKTTKTASTIIDIYMCLYISSVTLKPFQMCCLDR